MVNEGRATAVARRAIEEECTRRGKPVSWASVLSCFGWTPNAKYAPVVVVVGRPALGGDLPIEDVLATAIPARMALLDLEEHGLGDPVVLGQPIPRGEAIFATTRMSELVTERKDRHTRVVCVLDPHSDRERGAAARAVVEVMVQ